MRTELKMLGSQIRLDLNLGKQPLFLLTLIIYLFYWFVILTGNVDYPHTVHYYSEMGMFPVVIMLTILLFEREIGGGSMEVIGTYPVSLRLMAVRKWIVALVLVALAGMGWMAVYRIKFGSIMTVMHPWHGGESVSRQAGYLELLLQTMPAYMLLASLAVLGIAWLQKLYGGLILAFSLWVLDTVSMGTVLGDWTLYAAFLPKDSSFIVNRVVLLISACLFMILALWLVGMRERWIGREEE
ncbi:hypothetical protein [Paenibacillus bouchesdurhonensis]|uniref:hypothetical protein n=1 Tax=Paenibacillus bouchesdurhonensis TaxID=1870990 RepID=UPI000DA6226E|nr:hypothetical protein [Paenibacillus bouchesdurhonensis]